MENLEIVAVAKAISDRTKKFTEAREAVGAGEYAVDFMVHVTGGIKVGDDYEQVCAPEADPWGLLAVALSKLNGVTLAAIVTEHLDADADTIKEVKAKAKEALAAIKEPTRKPYKGKVTTSLVVESVTVAAS